MNMRKDITIVIILAVIIIVLLALLLLPKPVQSPVQNNQPPADIEVFSPKAGDTISSPLKITGIVRGNGWSGFEGQAGQVILFDNNGKILGRGVLTATTD